MQLLLFCALHSSTVCSFYCKLQFCAPEQLRPWMQLKTIHTNALYVTPMYHRHPCASCFRTWQFLLIFYCLSFSCRHSLRLIFLLTLSYISSLLVFLVLFFHKLISARFRILIFTSFSFTLILLLYLCFFLFFFLLQIFFFFGFISLPFPFFLLLELPLYFAKQTVDRRNTP